VLAGWIAGLLWALLCWTAASWLQKQGKIEPPTAPAS
jgi:undecaprenyl-diphosphatase